MFEIPDPDGFLSASDVKDVAEEVITPLPLPDVDGSPLYPGDIWLVVIMACTNQNSIWDTCNDTDRTPCDDTISTWLHTLNRHWLEVVANLLLGRLAMTILDPDRSRIVSIDSSTIPTTAARSERADRVLQGADLQCGAPPRDPERSPECYRHSVSRLHIVDRCRRRCCRLWQSRRHSTQKAPYRDRALSTAVGVQIRSTR